MADSNVTCIMCPRRGQITCQGCLDAIYCSDDCQKLDSANHKILCASFNASRTNIADDERRILVFPSGDKSPHFAWVKCPRDIQAIPGGVLSHEIGYNDLQGRPLDSGYRITLSLHHNAQRTEANLGLRNFTRGAACWQGGFCGKVFARRLDKYLYGRTRQLDITMRDVRNVADRLSQYNRMGHDQEHLRDMLMLGTAVNSADGVTRHGKKWMKVFLNGNDEIWSHPGSSIANLLGLPLLCRPASPVKTADDSNPRSLNRDIRLLYRDVCSSHVLDIREALSPDPAILDPEASLVSTIFEYNSDHQNICVGIRGFSSTPAHHSITTAETYYLMRADHKPFPPQHAQALCSFIKEMVEPKLAAAVRATRENERVADREHILQFISRAEFQKYYEEYEVLQMANGDRSWIDLPGPYEIDNDNARFLFSNSQATLDSRRAMEQVWRDLISGLNSA